MLTHSGRPRFGVAGIITWLSGRLSPFITKKMHMTSTSFLVCPLCGGANQCAIADSGEAFSACWCFKVPVSKQALAEVPADQIYKACLCPRCAAGNDVVENQTGIIFD
jgi:hypothetical protein